MRGDGVELLRAALARKRDAIVRAWLAETLRSYAEHTARFLSQDTDPFRNPAGHTLSQGLPALYDALLGGMDAVGIAPLLDPIVRMRAVQDFSPSQAIAFVFLLKPVIRAVLKDDAQPISPADGLAAVETRIDAMALLAFDLFVQCREQISEIRAGEAGRRTFVWDRMNRKRTGVG